MATITDVPYGPYYSVPMVAWAPQTGTFVDAGSLYRARDEKESLFIVELFRNEDYATYCAVWAYDKEEALCTARETYEFYSLPTLSPIFESALSVPTQLEFNDGVSSTWRVRVY